MRLVRYDSRKLGLLTDDGAGIVDLTERLDLSTDEPMVEYIRGDHDASPYADADPDVAVADVTLETPIRRPGKVVAAPSNYAEHVAEMSGGPATGPKSYFLKASSSVVGPEATIELPFADRRFDHEIELAFVLGEDVKDVSADDFADVVFGYTILIDVSMRGDEDRSNRKSYDTFTVVGPCLTTADEVDDPQDLDLLLELNGETRQDSNTRHMIRSCADFLELASIGTTIHVGDIVTTGTPNGVSELADGDVIDVDVEAVGSMQLDVTERDVRHADLDI